MSEEIDSLLRIADDYQYPDLNVFIQNRKLTPLKDKLVYAHQLDQKIASILTSVPVQYSINNIMNVFTEFSLHDLISNGIHVSPKNYPEVYKILLSCSECLHIQIPRLIVSEGATSEAFTAGSDGDCSIVISSYLINSLDTAELTFVIGHECGHIQNRHVSLNNIAQLLISSGTLMGLKINPALATLLVPLRYSIGVPLATWSRSSEITADRAGLLTCRDQKSAETALLKLAGGTTQSGVNDMEDFLRRHEEDKAHSHPAKLKGYLASHPPIYQRILALRAFIDSRIYEELTDGPVRSNSIDKAELEKRVGAILKI